MLSDKPDRRTPQIQLYDESKIVKHIDSVNREVFRQAKMQEIFEKANVGRYESKCKKFNLYKMINPREMYCIMPVINNTIFYIEKFLRE